MAADGWAPLDWHTSPLLVCGLWFAGLKFGLVPCCCRFGSVELYTLVWFGMWAMHLLCCSSATLPVPKRFIYTARQVSLVLTSVNSCTIPVSVSNVSYINWRQEKPGSDKSVQGCPLVYSSVFSLSVISRYRLGWQLQEQLQMTQIQRWVCGQILVPSRVLISTWRFPLGLCTLCQSSMVVSQALPFHYYTIFSAAQVCSALLSRDRLSALLAPQTRLWPQRAAGWWPRWGAGKVLLISLSNLWLRPTQSAHPDWKGVTYAPWETALMAKPKLKLVSQPDEKLLLCFPSSFEAGGAAWAGRKSGGLILVGVTLNMDERANTGQKVNARSSLGKKEGQKRDGSPWGNRGKN